MQIYGKFPIETYTNIPQFPRNKAAWRGVSYGDVTSCPLDEHQSLRLHFSLFSLKVMNSSLLQIHPSAKLYWPINYKTND